MQYRITAYRTDPNNAGENIRNVTMAINQTGVLTIISGNVSESESKKI
jgi:hypothetical protein